VGLRAVLDAVVKRKIPSPRRKSKAENPIVQSAARRRQKACSKQMDISSRYDLKNSSNTADGFTCSADGSDFQVQRRTVKVCGCGRETNICTVLYYAHRKIVLSRASLEFQGVPASRHWGREYSTGSEISAEVRCNFEM
jgi:hypothetical protein